MHSAARPLLVTMRSPPRRPRTAKAVSLLCICHTYAPLMFSIEGRNATGGRRRGGGKSSGKFCSLCCVCCAYALHKALPSEMVPAARPASPTTPNFKSRHMLGLHTAWSEFQWSLLGGRLGICWICTLRMQCAVYMVGILVEFARRIG